MNHDDMSERSTMLRRWSMQFESNADYWKRLSAIIVVGGATIFLLLTLHPDLMWNVVRLLAKRLRTMDEVLSDSVFLDVTGRTAKRIVELSNGQNEFTLPVTQEELAGMVGASRERVNKAIASFIRLHWIEQQDRHYKILNRQSLEQRSH